MIENMISFATVIAIEGKYVCCELEMHSVEESLQMKSSEKENVIVEIPLEQVTFEIGEGDILVIEHSDETIIMIHGKDEEEHQRRKIRMEERYKALLAMIG